jgi:PleD family two-component response regulator
MNRKHIRHFSFIEIEYCPFTISIGATLFGENDTIASLIKRADTLLYKCKESGRNCLTTK